MFGHLFFGEGDKYNIGSAEKPLAAIYANNIFAETSTADERVKASAQDTTPGYLVNKIVAGNLLDKALISDGSLLELSVNSTPLLLRDGSHSLTGNLGVAPGVTIDGVDIDVFEADYIAHKGNPDAHHARATAVAPLNINGQQVSLLLAPNPGLVGDTNGLRLGTPSTINVSSTNSVSGAGHTHTVASSANVGTSPHSALLRSTSEGGLTLASLETTGAVDVGQGFTAGSKGLRVIYETHDYPHVHVVVNPGDDWVFDEQFGVDIDDNLLVRGWIVGKHAIQLDGATMILHFDGPKRSPDLSGQTRGHMGQVPTSERSLTFAPGKFGMAVHVPPATTNMITNPSFETGTAAWGNYSSGNATGTRQRTTELSYAGNYSYRLQKTGGAVDARWGISSSAYPVTNGKTYTVSAWVNITAASGGTGAFRMEAGGAAFSGVNIAGPTDGWQRITFTVTAGSTGNLFIYLFTHNANTMTVFVDAVQLEEQGYATAYCDGSLGSGHSWSGSEHASASSRLDGSLDYNAEGVINRPKGSFMAWVKAAAVDNQMVMSLAAGTWIRLNSNGAIDYTWGGTTRSGVSAYTVDTWYHVALTWEGTTVTFYVNGVQVDQTTASNLPPAGVLSIGYYRPNNNQRWTGLIDDVVILNRAANEDEIRAVYESNAPVFAETSTWHWRAGRNRVYADSEGLWAYGASGGAILGLYAGDENDPAATKSWGGVNLTEGDFLIGNATDGYLMWDNDAVANKLRIQDAALDIYNGPIRLFSVDNTGVSFGTQSHAAWQSTGLWNWNYGNGFVIDHYDGTSIRASALFGMAEDANTSTRQTVLYMVNHTSGNHSEMIVESRTVAPAANSMAMLRAAFVNSSIGVTREAFVRARTYPTGKNDIWIHPGSDGEVVMQGSIYARGVYTNTVASATNVNVDSEGRLRRSTSSRRYKRDIRPLPDLEIAKLLDLRPVLYKAKAKPDMHRSEQGRDFVGLIAEEVDEAGLGAVVEYDDAGRPDYVMYDRLTALLVGAIQNLDQRLRALEAV